MDEFSRAAERIINKFDLILIASERVREIEKQRRKELEGAAGQSRRKQLPLHTEAFKDIAEGKVGQEYLLKVADRGR